MVGARGFEPPTPSSRTTCATRLRYAPPNHGTWGLKKPAFGAPGSLRGGSGGVKRDGNRTELLGGGVFRVSNSDDGTFAMDRSTVDDNRVVADGEGNAGGLYLQGLAIAITDSTITIANEIMPTQPSAPLCTWPTTQFV